MTLRRNSINGNGEQINKQVSTRSKISVAPTPSSVLPTGLNSSSWTQTHQTLLLASLSVKNSLMGNTLSLSTPVLSFLQKRTMTYMIKKWQPSSMDSNVAIHTSLALITQLWSAQTTKTCSTSANHRKSQAAKPNGWNS